MSQWVTLSDVSDTGRIWLGVMWGLLALTTVLVQLRTVVLPALLRRGPSGSFSFRRVGLDGASGACESFKGGSGEGGLTGGASFKVPGGDGALKKRVLEQHKSFHVDKGKQLASPAWQEEQHANGSRSGSPWSHRPIRTVISPSS